MAKRKVARTKRRGKRPIRTARSREKKERPYDGLPLPWMRAFCLALEQDPSATRAARLVGKSRSTVQEARDRYPEFAEAWEEGKLAFKDGLESLLSRKVKRNTTALIFALKKYIPERFEDRVQLDVAPLIVWNVPVGAQASGPVGEAIPHTGMEPATERG